MKVKERVYLWCRTSTPTPCVRKLDVTGMDASSVQELLFHSGWRGAPPDTSRHVNKMSSHYICDHCDAKLRGDDD
jgi:hypothetical protein